MQRMGLAEFEAEAAEFDELVAETPDIDRFCSSTDWILPAASALMPPRTPWLFRGEHGRTALMRGEHSEGWRYVEPLEASWGLACPVVGPDPALVAGEFGALCREHEREWDVLVLSGLPLGSPLVAALARSILARYEIVRDRVTSRHVASLRGGLDGFLARRSRNFRRALRRAVRTAEHAGFGFETCHTPAPGDLDGLFGRMMDIEARSWKGRAGVGVDSGGMREFYRRMIARLAARGGLRLMFARDPSRAVNPDVAYVLGGTFGAVYRGLQFSFDADYERWALGNLCQYQQISELCREDFEAYDLGTTMDYKSRWAECTRDSIALIVVQRFRYRRATPTE